MKNIKILIVVLCTMATFGYAMQQQSTVQNRHDKPGLVTMTKNNDYMGEGRIQASPIIPEDDADQIVISFDERLEADFKKCEKVCKKACCCMTSLCGIVLLAYLAHR